ncbi:MAG: hypothetical protein ACRD10_09505, partial [Terriglobia bacterium]
MKKKLWILCPLLWAVIGVASAGLAQNPPPPPPPPLGFPPGPVYAQQFMIMTAGPMMESNIVTGTPYSGESETEIHQTLSDGNHIDHKETSWVYRDNVGRIRHERTLSILGPLSAQGKMVTLFDPVAHATYVLDHARKTASKMPGRLKGMVGAAGGPMGKMNAGGGITTMAIPNGPEREFKVRVMGGGMAGGDFPGGDFIY